MRLFTPAEDSSWHTPLATQSEEQLVAVIADRLKLAYRVQGDKTFLGHAPPDARPALKPAPNPSVMKTRMGTHDLHAVIDNGRMAAFNRDGKSIFSCEARTRGSNGGPEVQGGDTPPGLYKAGLITWTRRDEPLHIQHSYGPVFIDLVEQESQEASRGRAGVGHHGGGTGLANPLAARQGWMV
ncbi:MAG: hypothetical protein ACH37Z_18780, partial [Anaerolineae bacterium]